MSLRPRPMLAKLAIIAPTDAIVRMQPAEGGVERSRAGGNDAAALPYRVLGHLGIGNVEQVGDSVVGFRVGDSVLVSCIGACGQCAYCRKYMYSHCATGGWILAESSAGSPPGYLRIPHAQRSLTLLSDESQLGSGAGLIGQRFRWERLREAHDKDS
jgi:alcohol dehydrogenase